MLQLCEKFIKGSLNKKMIFILALFVFVLMIATSYGLWQLTLKQTGENTVTTSCFKVEFTDKNAITLNDAFPLSEVEGRS